jgi:hypothetical protein
MIDEGLLIIIESLLTTAKGYIGQGGRGLRWLAIFLLVR